MNPPVFSIIMPTYNSAHCVGGAIESIKSQDFDNWELWVIDGVSKDETEKVVNDFSQSDSRIHFVSEKDKGIYDAMNKGIRFATGNWLYFLGSDDRLYNTQVLASVAQHLQNRTSGIVYGNVIMNGSKYDGVFTSEKLLQKNISHQAIFYHRTVFQLIGLYNLNYKLHADWDFNLRYFTLPEHETYYVDLMIASFGEGGVSAAHDVDFIRGSLLPRKLAQLSSNVFMLRKIKSFDDWWRLIRNAGIRGDKQLEALYGEMQVPRKLKAIANWQSKIPAKLLRMGVVSKAFMCLCYLITLFQSNR